MNEQMILSGFADEIAQELGTQIRVMKKLGISHIEMRGVDGEQLVYHSMEKVQEIKKHMDENGMNLSAVGSPIGKIGIDEEFTPHFELLKRTVEIAHMMDTPNIRMFSFYLPDENEPQKYQSQVFERLGKMVDYATKNDVVLLHENEKGIYGAKALECLDLMKEFYGKHFKAVFDFANFVQVKQDTLEAFELLKPYISYIHVKDALWKTGAVVPVGYGDGNVEKILQRLQNGGYQGYLSLEPHLFDFKGFADLEQGETKSIQTEGNRLSGEEAFEVAFRSLEKILERLK